MKLLTELTQQFSLTEWFKAFFNHTPTAGRPSIKGGCRLAYKGGTLAERTEALQKLQNQIKNQFN